MDMLIAARCHTHPQRPFQGCGECDTALEVTHLMPLGEIIARGLALAWYRPAR